MDAKAEDTETAGAAAAETDDGQQTSDASSEAEAGKAVKTIEERLEAGFKKMDSRRQTPDDSSEKPPVETDDSPEKPPAETDDGQQTPDDSQEKTEGDDGEIADGEVEGLSAKAQAKINARIHELNIKRKNAELKAEQTEARLKELDGKIQDENVKAAIKIGIDPEYINADEAKTLNRFENLREWRKWLRAHRDGYEGSGEKDDHNITAAEIAKREAEVEDELLDIGGTARALWLERTKQMRADMELGRKTRLAEKAKPIVPAKKLDPKPPKLPETNGATRKPPVSAKSKGKAVFDIKEFNASGADDKALEKQFEKLYG